MTDDRTNYRPQPAPITALPETHPRAPMTVEPLPAKPRSRSLTWWGILATVAGALLTGFGYQGGADFLADGLQWTDVGPIVVLLGWAAATWGQRRARQPVALALLFLFAVPAQAQSLASEAGAITVTPSAVHYRTAVLDTMVSRDLLAVLPKAGHYQHVGDDLGMILDIAEWKGQVVPDWVPAADSGLVSLLDSLETAAAWAQTTISSLGGQIDRQRAHIDSLQTAFDSLQAVREEEARACAANAQLVSEYAAFVQGVRRILRGLLEP